MNHQFTFDADLAAIFDDMLQRSVPLYPELQRMLAELTVRFARPHGVVYDLGCATGNTLVLLDRQLQDTGIRFIGLDSSEPVLQKAREKWAALGNSRGRCQFLLGDLNDVPPLEPASVIILNLTLQFVRPDRRSAVLDAIHQALLPGGCLLLVEKIRGEEEATDAFFIHCYHDLKRRNGYSDQEIADKQQALQNVLIPLRLSENMALLQQAGFSTSELFFKWYNFAGILAVK